MHRVILDAGSDTVVAVCTCGWRAITLSKPIARRAACEHEVRAHPGQRVIRGGLGRHAARQAASVPTQ